MTNLWQTCTLVMTNLWQACCKLKLLSGMQLHKLFGGQLLFVLFLKLINIIAIHLQSPDLGQRRNLVDYRLHRILFETPQCHIQQHSLANASTKQE
ncbi:hypothetical protein AVEN_72556-1 [Araneus ventricosus]|uniref:Uncharacterized protein n=1 Tax=Araneus ventricosus TaxID=182803 RepID=A0A4Y2IU42_ARAVE|nr:hypothetical protein AVEN_72556-1 [Araneus ventricosus]